MQAIRLAWLAGLAASAAAVALPALPARADDEAAATYDRVSFSVERATHVDNDRVLAQLSAEAEGKDPAELADTVNQAMAWALAKVRATEGVEGRTSGYQTSRRQVDKDHRVWFVSQQLTLETGDAAGLRALLGELQERLLLQGLSFAPSDERRREAEDDTIDAALGAFRARADRVTAALGFAGWRIVELSIGPQMPPPMPRQNFSMMREAAVAPPELEAGRSEVRVTVQGTVELRH